MHLHSFLLSLAKVVLLGATIPAFGAEFYVATNGSDATGDGTRANPWASITHALDRASSDDVVSVQPGTYSGRVRLRGNFDPPVRVRSEVPYQARLRNGDRVVTAYEDARGTRGIVLEGFDIAHTGPGAGALVIHIDGGGDGSVSHITVRNNIVHDSFNNDLLKVNNFSTNVTIERNMFYNQEGSDEHIDANGVRDVVIQDNVFFNDFSGSGRTNPNNTSSYVVIKDSNGSADGLVGARDVTLRRNVFLNWEGSTGHNFVLVGEDGQPFHEAFDITVENSLMLGNSANTMRSPLSVKGGRSFSQQHHRGRSTRAGVRTSARGGGIESGPHEHSFLQQCLVRPNRHDEPFFASSTGRRRVFRARSQSLLERGKSDSRGQRPSGQLH